MACIQDYYHENLWIPNGSNQPNQSQLGLHHGPCSSSLSSKERNRSHISTYRPIHISYTQWPWNHASLLPTTHQTTTSLPWTASRNITHNLLDSNVEQLRLELGIDSSNGDWHTDETLCYLTPSWLRDLLHFCSNHNITLQDDLPTIPTRTTHLTFNAVD